MVVSQEGREVDEKGKENGPEDRDDGVKFPHEFQGKTEDWEVQDKVRDADRNAGQVVYNHGDTCQPASQELVRDEEGIDADGIMKARRFQKSGVRYSDIERDAILVPFCRAQETRAIVNKAARGITFISLYQKMSSMVILFGAGCMEIRKSGKSARFPVASLVVP